MELEFVQCLSNPGYLMHLAATRLLYDPAFIRYLEYLRYWKRPEYAKFIVWPAALYFLDLLQEEDFRQKLLLEPDYAQTLAKQMELHWRFYRQNQLFSGADEPSAVKAEDAPRREK